MEELEAEQGEPLERSEAKGVTAALAQGAEAAGAALRVERAAAAATES